MTFDLVRWLADVALPLWADAGVDAASGMFVERLDLKARPLLDVPRRAMVQARQIFVFAEAEMRGWHAGGALAERAAETLVATFLKDGGGWSYAATRDARPCDESIDLYTQAFVLFALAALARMTGSQRWLHLADATLAFLDSRMATPATGGYAEALPSRAAPRRQNPHMHLLEALLALEQASSGRGYLDRAEAMITLLERRFLHGPHLVLVEHYDKDLRPLFPPPFTFEPGHHFEWAWLLAKYAEIAARPRSTILAVQLDRTARCFGLASSGLPVDEVAGDGRVLNRSTRLWPCSEALRASTVDARREFPRTSPDIFADLIYIYFIQPAKSGCWIEHLSEQRTPLVEFVPASSLYHLVGAAGAIADFNII